MLRSWMKYFGNCDFLQNIQKNFLPWQTMIFRDSAIIVVYTSLGVYEVMFPKCSCSIEGGLSAKYGQTPNTWWWSLSDILPIFPKVPDYFAYVRSNPRSDGLIIYSLVETFFFNMENGEWKMENGK